MDNVVKVSLIGSQNVGKTAIRKMLEGHVSDPSKRDPTIGVGFGKFQFDDTACAVWDLGGQKQFQFMWDSFMKGTKLTVVVTDSTENNITETKEICERFNRFQGSKVIALANKQDRPGALPPDEVGRRLGIKTFGTIAVDATKMADLHSIIKNELAG